MSQSTINTNVVQHVLDVFVTDDNLDNIITQWSDGVGSIRRADLQDYVKNLSYDELVEIMLEAKTSYAAVSA